MLDSVVGPGHAVVTTTAELDFDQTETNTRDVHRRTRPLPALSESISREAYNGGGNGTGGVLGPDNIQVPSGDGSSAGTAASTRTATPCATTRVNKVTEARQERARQRSRS